MECSPDGEDTPGSCHCRDVQLTMEMITDTGCLGSCNVMEPSLAIDLRDRGAEGTEELISSLFGMGTLMRMP